MRYVITTNRKIFCDKVTWDLVSKDSVNTGDIPTDVQIAGTEDHYGDQYTYRTWKEAEAALKDKPAAVTLSTPLSLVSDVLRMDGTTGVFIDFNRCATDEELERIFRVLSAAFTDGATGHN